MFKLNIKKILPGFVLAVSAAFTLTGCSDTGVDPDISYSEWSVDEIRPEAADRIVAEGKTILENMGFTDVMPRIRPDIDKEVLYAVNGGKCSLQVFITSGGTPHLILNTYADDDGHPHVRFYGQWHSMTVFNSPNKLQGLGETKNCTLINSTTTNSIPTTTSAPPTN